MGIATTRYEDRIMAATGIRGNAVVKFESHDAVVNGGVLFMLPALIEMGLFKTAEVYQIPHTDYYGLQHIILTLAFMALLRIPNPEQLKQCKPGELGKTIGLDRIPEVRCLREKIHLLSAQNHAQELNGKLVDHWNERYPEEELFLYIDGHVRIYFGDKANLPVKYVSRQKLCLNATTEYWVNDKTGQPVMMVMGELTEKLQHAIENQVIPQLQKTTLLPAAKSEQISVVIPEETRFATHHSPVFTLVFDREAYDVPFFNRLWDMYKIAILTYRKNVKDMWLIECFQSADIQVIDHTLNMRICEKQVTLGGTVFREVRRLTDSGHQTSIITNNMVISKEIIAGRMFSRWSQENFFRYMKSDYNLDSVIEYGTEEIDEIKEVVNPAYNKINHRLKKHREKLRRLQAGLTSIQDQTINVALDKMFEIEQQHWVLTEKIEQHKEVERQLLAEREKTTKRIMLKDMPEDKRYNKLKTESKILMNCLKMICYRAETAIANILAETQNVSNDEKRMLVKQITGNNADISPDYKTQTLTITLHTLAAPRYNLAAAKLAQLLNDTKTIFPGTSLQMIFKTTSH